MNCPVEEQPLGNENNIRQPDERQNRCQWHRPIRGRPSRSLVATKNIYFPFLLLSGTLSLSVNSDRGKRLSQHVCVVTATETQSPSDWSMTHFILSILPCGCRERGHGGTKAVSWCFWLRLNPGTLWGFTISKDPHWAGRISLSANMPSCAAHAHQGEAGDRHTVLIAQCVCVFMCGVCLCVQLATGSTSLACFAALNGRTVYWHSLWLT